MGWVEVGWCDLSVYLVDFGFEGALLFGCFGSNAVFKHL